MTRMNPKKITQARLISLIGGLRNFKSHSAIDIVDIGSQFIISAQEAAAIEMTIDVLTECVEDNLLMKDLKEKKMI